MATRKTIGTNPLDAGAPEWRAALKASRQGLALAGISPEPKKLLNVEKERGNAFRVSTSRKVADH